MTTRRRSTKPSLKLVLIALIAGLAAGAAAVYLKHAGAGNGKTNAEAAAAAGDCAPDAAAASKIAPYAKGEVAALVPAQKPLSFAGLAFKDGSGKDIKLSDFSGKTLLLNVWATWCVPCRAEMPALNTLQKTMGSEKFEVVAIDVDTGGDDKVTTFRRDHGIDRLGLYRDNTMGVFNALKKEGLALGLPATLLIDPKGCLVASMNGPAAWDSPDAAQLIKAATAL